MLLTAEENAMLAGELGPAVRTAMRILAALGKIYQAESMLPVSSVQVSGVSFDNLGEAGLDWLAEMAAGGARARVLTTLNPAGMDVENWRALGISPDFAANQQRVLDAFSQMGILPTCTCTPYLVGNLPHFGEHIAWAESSAVCFANSVLGARTNREGGPSALAAAVTGRTPAYGLHLDENRKPGLTIIVDCELSGTRDFGALGVVVGRAIEKMPERPIPYFTSIASATLEELKSLCASIATYGGSALFHIEGITPEASQFSPAARSIKTSRAEIDSAILEFDNPAAGAVDFVSLGCPHLSIREIAEVASLLQGRQVRKEVWITTARPTKRLADQVGYTQIIEAAGAKFAADTCCVVAPITGRFKVMATDSAKACYYAFGKNHFRTRFLTLPELIEEACR